MIRSSLCRAATAAFCLVLLAGVPADARLQSNDNGPVTPSLPVAGTHDCSGYYPEISRRLNVSGDALVEYDVDAEGNIVHVHLLTSSGNDTLDAAAVACVASHWRNTSAMRGNVAVASPGHRALIEFRLRGGMPPAQARPLAFDPGSLPWDSIARSLRVSMETVTGFLLACGLLASLNAFVHWLFRERGAG